MMRSSLEILLFVVPLLLTAYSLKVEPLSIRIVAWIVSGLILTVAVLIQLKKAGERKKQQQRDREYRRMLEGELVRQASPGGQPATYADGLPDSPLLGRFFAQGQEYEREFKFEEAMEEYRKCLLHPDATEENKVAANMLIGNCHYSRSRFKEAEEHYREALKISKRVKDKKERLQGKAFALGNIGIVLTQEGDLDGALESYRKVLDIEQELGRPRSIANAYGNIGLVLAEKGDLEGALEYHRKALELDEKIGNPSGMAADYVNIANIHSQNSDYKAAAILQLQALHIYSQIGMKRHVGMAQHNLSISVRKLKDQDKFEEFLQEAKEKFGEEVEKLFTADETD
jgi:tetratricopeptide (TPR) repeat protein